MKTLISLRISRAFTRTDLLVCLCILSVFASIFAYSGNVNWFTARSRIECVNNLRLIGVSFRSFASDHRGLFPMQISTNTGGSAEYLMVPLQIYRHFQVLSNELSTPKIVICPSDIGRYESANFHNDFSFPPQWRAGNKAISYFMGLDTSESYPSMLLAGDRNITNMIPTRLDTFLTGQPAIAIMGTNHTASVGAGWNDKMHQNVGNVALGDGSVHQMDTPRLRDHLRKTGDAFNRVAVPY